MRRLRHWRPVIAIAGLGLLGIPMFGANRSDSTQPQSFPAPGTVNYIEGAVSLDGDMLINSNVTINELHSGQELSTGRGKAEILLTPGVFLRVDSNSSVKMISRDPAKTKVALKRGRASVEVDRTDLENMVQIVDHGVTTRLIKIGYYEFDADHPEAMVYKGKAEVEVGDGKWEAVENHHELTLVPDGVPEKTAIDPRPAGDELYDWSRLRSQDLAQANHQIARQYACARDFHAGWYWNPWMRSYTFLGWYEDLSPFGADFYPWGGPRAPNGGYGSYPGDSC